MDNRLRWLANTRRPRGCLKLVEAALVGPVRARPLRSRHPPDIAAATWMAWVERGLPHLHLKPSFDEFVRYGEAGDAAAKDGDTIARRRRLLPRLRQRTLLGTLRIPRTQPIVSTSDAVIRDQAQQGECARKDLACPR